MTGPTDTDSGPAPNRRHAFVGHAYCKRSLRGVGLRLLPAVHTALGRTARLAVPTAVHADSRRHLDKPHIAVFWHRDLLLGFYLMSNHSRFGSQVSRPVGALLSPSDDGAVLARSLIRLGYDPIYGSSRLGGAGARVSMIERLNRGYRLVATPDGPLGPARAAKPGLLSVAMQASVPVLPVGYACYPQIQLSNWDQLVLPAFGTLFAEVIGAPLWVPANASRTERHALTRKLSRQIDGACLDAEQTLTRALHDRR